MKPSRFFLFTVLITLSVSFIFSEPEQPHFRLEGTPSSLFNGSVDVIYGSYCEEETDLILQGSSPFAFSRSYSSGLNDNGTLRWGWSGSHMSYVTILQDPSSSNINAHPYPTWSRATVLQPLGSMAFFSAVNKRNGDMFKIDMGQHSHGLTNCGSGEIGGRTSVKNHVLSTTGGGKWGCLQKGSGAKIHYKERGSGFYVVESQDFADGNKFLYDYHPYDQRLTKTKITDSSKKKVFGWADHDIRGAENYKITGHSGQWVHYSFFRHDYGKERYYLSKVTSSDSVDTNYTYELNSPWYRGKIIRRDAPEGRYLETEYYGHKTNMVGDVPIDVNAHKDDLRIGRVRQQKAPVGTDATPVIVSRFFYDLYRDKQHRFAAGSTTVFNALNHKSIYRFNYYHRLTSIERYQNQAIAFTENTVWGDDIGVDAANLIASYTANRNKKTALSRTLKYDDRGNVIEERLWGNLTGKKTELFSLDSKGVPKEAGIESYKITQTYSNDGFNLLLSKVEDNGRAIYYTYKPGSDVLVSEKLFWQGRQVSRSFYEYDADGIFIRSFQDDGQGSALSDLAGVSQRIITSVTPSKAVTTFGLPVEEREDCLDLASGQVITMKKIISHYGNLARLSYQEFYGANNSYLYTISYVYDEKGRVIEERDSRGRVIQSRYDANGNKVFSQGPCFDFYTEQLYDYSNRLIRKEQVHHNGKRLVETFRYDYLGQKVFSVDSSGRETKYVYDELGRLVEVINPQTAFSSGLKSGRKRFKYDFMGNCVEVENERGFRSYYSFNGRSEQLCVEHEGSFEKELHLYNLDGTLRKQIDKSGSYSLYTYDYKGRVILTENYDASDRFLSSTSENYSFFNLLSSTDEEGRIISYEYDGAGRLICQKQGYSKVEFGYDVMGNQNKVVTYFGENKTDFMCVLKEYDLFSQLVKESKQGSDGKLQLYTSYLYDERGNCTHLIKEGDGGISETVTTYDSQNRVIKVIDPVGSVSYTHYDDTFHMPDGRRVVQRVDIDKLGFITESYINFFDKAEKIIRKSPVGVVLDQVDNSYDLLGNLQKSKHLLYHNEKPLYIVTTRYWHDSQNRLCRLEEAVGTKEQKVTSYEYGANGKLRKEIRPNLTQINYHYNGLGRLVKKEALNGAFGYNFKHDRSGRLLEVENIKESTSSKRLYDECGRVVRESLENGLVMEFAYDRMGRCSLLTLPDSSSVIYKHNALFMTEISRLSSAGKTLYTHSYLENDLSGRITKEMLIGRLGVVQQRWDKMGRQVKLSTPFHQWAIPNNGFDAHGNLLEIGGKDLFGSFQNNFSYDGMYHLSKERGSVKHDYSYDSRHNRRIKDGKKHLLSKVDTLLDDGEASYAYDASGLPIRCDKGEKVIHYSYDPLNRLTSMTEQESYRYCYTYDSFDRRMSKTAFSWNSIEAKWKKEKEERYLYQGEREIGSVNEAGAVLEFRILGRGRAAEIGATIALELQGNTYAPLHDHRGSIIGLIDIKSKDVTEGYRFTAFGEEAQSTSTNLKSPWRYGSKRVDEESGFIYFGRRYYLPSQGRWLTPDPLGFKAGPNLYAYVSANPFFYLDLFGLYEVKDKDSKRSPRSKRKSSRFFSNLLKAPGRFLEGLGRQLPATRYARESMQRIGQALKGGSLLDKPTQCLDHDSCREKGYYEKFGRGNSVKKEAVMLILGQLQSYLSTKQVAEELSKLHGSASVHTTLNPTSGLPCDLTGSSFLKMEHASDIVKAVVTNIRHRIDDLGGINGGGRISMYAHSQGAIIYSVASNYLTKKERDMVDLTTFGGGRMVKDSAAGSVRNIVSKNDPVPFLTDSLGILTQSNVTLISGSPGTIFGMDHGIRGDAYWGEISRESREYCERWGI